MHADDKCIYQFAAEALPKSQQWKITQLIWQIMHKNKKIMMKWKLCLSKSCIHGEVYKLKRGLFIVVLRFHYEEIQAKKKQIVQIFNVEDRTFYGPAFNPVIRDR